MNEIKSHLITYIQHLHPDYTEDPTALETRSLRSLLDSLDMLALLCFLEEQFSITLVEDEITPEQFATIERLSSFVARKQGLFS